jgi:hypothetical protein
MLPTLRFPPPPSLSLSLLILLLLDTSFKRGEAPVACAHLNDVHDIPESLQTILTREAVPLKSRPMRPGGTQTW